MKCIRFFWEKFTTKHGGKRMIYPFIFIVFFVSMLVIIQEGNKK
ncbi:hypothetical protein [Enterococcus hirae]|nr:hypothetical protein [Enterococcus hirae]